jgi:hypothetical protein
LARQIGDAAEEGLNPPKVDPRVTTASATIERCWVGDLAILSWARPERIAFTSWHEHNVDNGHARRTANEPAAHVKHCAHFQAHQIRRHREGPACSMPKKTTLKVVAGIALLFIGLVGTIVFLLARKVISVEMAILMLVALLAMYVGFGILIAVYRLIDKLE